MKKRYYTFLLFFLTFFTATAQQVLPHYPTAKEQAQLPGYLQSFRESEKVVPTPPPVPVRTMAEWEEVQALCITWTGFPEILTEITRAAVNECKVFIVTTNPGQVSNLLNNADVPLDSVEFVEHNFNSIWIRDYGPWTTYTNDVDSLTIIDWIYNRPRPLDNVIPAAIASQMNLPIYEAITPPYDWVHTGGNHLRDGMGTAFSSELVLMENPDKTEAEIDQIAYEYLGVNEYVKLPVLPYDAIHHLDMHMRIIDEETIIFGEYPEGVADGPQIEANIQYIKSNLTTPFGNPYQILRMPMPPDQYGRYPDDDGFYRTYTNSLFINKTVIVPIYEEQYDTTSLRLYEEYLPGYNIVGIDCNDIIPSSGALHCITKLVGTNAPLWIAHSRLKDTYDDENDYQAQAIIKHRSGISSASLFYKLDEAETYTEVPMTLTDAENHYWSAGIPAQEVGTVVQYYIHATANSGKEQVRPLVAPEGYFRFRVKGVEAAPTADFFYPLEASCMGQTLRFADNSEGHVASWQWSFPGGVPSTSSERFPEVLYSEAGTFDVSLIVTNELGADTIIYSEVVTIEGGVPPFTDEFTGGPNDAWTIENPSFDEAFWDTTTDGNCAAESFAVNNYDTDTRSTSDYFRTRFDLSGMTDIELSFAVAYAPYNDNFFDRLNVNIIDCDGNKTTVYSKAGSELATAPATTDAFIPTDCSEWRTETVDISTYADQLVTIEFENAGGYGNILYLDNIQFQEGQVANVPPMITLLAPADGTNYFDELPTINIEAEASDSDGQIAAVSFFVNGDSIGNVTELPYTHPFEVLEPGTYQFSARAQDDGGLMVFSDTATIEVSVINSLEFLPGAVPINLDVFPNPAKEQFTIQVESSQPLMLHYRLTNLLGQALTEDEWHVTTGKNNRTIPVVGLPAGPYLLHMSGKGWTSTEKITIFK